MGVSKKCVDVNYRQHNIKKLGLDVGPSCLFGRSTLSVGYLRMGYTKVSPQSSSGPLVDQLPTEQPCEAERPTNSPPSNPARRSNRSTLRGGAVDQLWTVQPCEAEDPTWRCWPTTATTRRVITNLRPDIHAAYQRHREVTIKHDWTPPRTTLDVSFYGLFGCLQFIWIEWYWVSLNFK
jgi:hypothetical protein